MQEEMGAADVARMVDMSLAEVADLLGQGIDNSPVTSDAASLAQEVVNVLVQLEASLCTGNFSDATEQTVCGDTVLVPLHNLHPWLE